MQSFSVVRMRASSLAFQMPTLNLARRGFRTLPDAGFRLASWGCGDVESRALGSGTWDCSDI